MTVFSETKSWVAIWRLLRPRAMRVRISNSRVVTPRACCWAVLAAKGLAEAMTGTWDFFHHNRFTPASKTEAKPDAESGEQNGYESAIELDGMLDDDETIFGVPERDDDETADQTEDEDVALHGVTLDRSVPEAGLPRSRKLEGRGFVPLASLVA